MTIFLIALGYMAFSWLFMVTIYLIYRDIRESRINSEWLKLCRAYHNKNTEPKN